MICQELIPPLYFSFHSNFVRGSTVFLSKEEEIGNLPDKEFRIMIVKLIQNLEIKMESQINSLEARIEKMQERFNKDLEEIKRVNI